MGRVKDGVVCCEASDSTMLLVYNETYIAQLQNEFSLAEYESFTTFKVNFYFSLLFICYSYKLIICPPCENGYWSCNSNSIVLTIHGICKALQFICCNTLHAGTLIR